MFKRSVYLIPLSHKNKSFCTSTVSCCMKHILRNTIVKKKERKKKKKYKKESIRNLTIQLDCIDWHINLLESTKLIKKTLTFRKEL